MKLFNLALSLTGVYGINLVDAHDDWDDYEPSFFNSYKNSERLRNPLYRAATIITAPIIFPVFSLCYLIAGVANLLFSLKNAIFETKKDSLEALDASLYCIGASVVCLFSTVISPIVNLVDLVGGAVNTCSSEDSDSNYAMR
ncbi:MAG: hypothetical protein P1U74_02205 [Legionellaceae bacterium]|nr:hypothetical protein [Legionellaceae bacterium]